MKTLWVQAALFHPQARPPAKTAFPNLGEFWRTARRWAQMDLWPRNERAGAGQGGVGEGIGFWTWMGWAVVGVSAFHAAYWFPWLNFLMVTFLFGLFQLARVRTGRLAMYGGLGVGLCVYGPQLAFFWKIFGPSAVALWLILACWLGLFLVLLRQAHLRLGGLGAGLLAPFLWLGLEYARGELYYLRFTWVTPGLALAGPDQTALAGWLGVYGVGFALMAIAGLLAGLPRRAMEPAVAAALVIPGLMFNLPNATPGTAEAQGKPIRVAGMQFEFPAPLEVEAGLNEIVQRIPDVELIVLSEYTFDGPIPERIKAWCRQHRKYLVAGGKEAISEAHWFNTVFVVGPAGEVVFSQAKSVPIQFFKDGLPAREQQLWDSPWGKLGIAICYDLSYTRVMDRLARLGAQGLIVPTMDVRDWGDYQHQLHARIAPVRAAEYGLPIFRVASSGISQLVDAGGRVIASAGCPGQGEILAGTWRLAHAPRLPWDRWLAPISVAITALWGLVVIIWARIRGGWASRRLALANG